jgi:hypothetical protein
MSGATGPIAESSVGSQGTLRAHLEQGEEVCAAGFRFGINAFCADWTVSSPQGPEQIPRHMHTHTQTPTPTQVCGLQTWNIWPCP